MSKHTPGPWTFNFFSYKIFDSQDESIAEVFSSNYGSETLKADTRLIAAAPEMLEVLELFIKEFDNNINCDGLDDYECYNLAKQLIIRVKGEA